MPRFKSSNPEHQRYEDAVRIHQAVGGLEIATGDDGTNTVEIPSCPAVLVSMDVMPGGLVGDTFDLYVQTRLNATSGWFDVVHFNQVLGNVGVTVLQHTVISPVAVAEPMFLTSAALAAGAERHIMGLDWRTRWEIVNAGAASFYFNAFLTPMG